MIALASVASVGAAILFAASLGRQSAGTSQSPSDGTQPMPSGTTGVQSVATSGIHQRDLESQSTWTGNPRPQWARDGSKTVAFQLEATHDVRVWMKQVRPVLAVRCLYGKTEVYVVAGSPASIERDDRHKVRVSFDNGPETVQSWEDSEDSKELFAPDGVAFAQRIAEAKTLRFGFTPYNAAPVVAVFDVSGFDRLVGVVAKTCRWK
jgi:hypothetical protein